MLDNEVLDYFGRKNLQAINHLIQTAYVYADAVLDENKLFEVRSAWSFRQNVRNLAVDSVLEEGCTSGKLEFQCVYQSNSVRNCSHLVLTDTRIMLTHSAVRQNDLPPFSLFREEYASSNQLNWFAPEVSRVRPNYGIITHTPDPSGSGSAVTWLVVPDEEYGYAVNKIALKDVLAPVVQIVEPTSSDDFGFRLRERNVQAEEI